MKINNIEIENYRVFKDKHLIEFNNQNILLYGENGSGKTSLYNALQDFFFYHKDESKSKLNIEKNKNIFAKDEDNSKITIKFNDNTKIIFDKNGFDSDLIKSKIEEVSKSKLFLTYQDVYNLNNIFKQDISYKEFKEIFTILYYDELNDKFNEFEKNYIKISKIVKNKNTLEKYLEYLTISLNNFIIDDLQKMDELSEEDENKKYTKVFYLSENYEFRLNEYKEMIDKFFEIIANKNTLEFDVYSISEQYDTIDININAYTLENCRYTANNIEIDNAEKVEIDSFKPVDDLFDSLESVNEFITDFSICEELSMGINEIIYNKLDSSIDSIKDIIDFLNVPIKIHKILEKPFLNFNVDYIFSQYIRNIEFELLLSGKELKNHWNSLNEAKVSALNIAIYLSSILGKKPSIPILVLDDLLISLDMSNRDKIVDLLLDRSIKENGSCRFFDDHYQMFIFTHDRAFYEMAKYKFENLNKSNWEYIEMYEDNFEAVPNSIIIQSKSNLEKANAYLKLCDYPAAGNYLRKASEENIKNKLLDSFQPSEKDGLDRTIQKYEEMCKSFSIPISKNIICLKGLTKRVFNPSSHDDLISPLYKKEIQDAINIVEKISELPEIKITESSIKKESLLKFNFNEKYEIVYIFLGDINLYTYKDTIVNRDAILLSKSMHKILVDEEWKECWKINNKFYKLEKIFKIMSFFINKEFKVQLDVEAFISSITINGELLNEDIKKLIRRQCS